MSIIDKITECGRAMGKSVAFVTMGCAKNEVDTSHMQARLLSAGYEISDDPERADAIIVNTCSFIQSATEESIEAILDAAGIDSVVRGDAKLIVAGCMPARYGSELYSELPEVSAFVTCAEEESIVSVVDAQFGIERISPSSAFAQGGFLPEGTVSAYVKISDGCDRFCAYCAIPYIRGRYHSFPLVDIVSEVEDLVSSGVREIVLIAQDTGRWGKDFEKPSTLATLVDTLASQFSKTWFRIMYIQPEGVTDELIDVIARYDNVCSYFDIPFQHANAELLRSMNRSGDTESHLKLLERIRKRIPDAALRTTLIAGYPGETDAAFEELCDFVEEAPLDYVGVFAYSREEGTRAYDLDNQIDEDEKLSRAQTLRDLADAVCAPRIASRIGSIADVLVCGVEEDGQLFGRTKWQAPDVDGVTYIDGGLPGEFVKTRIEDALLYEMEGTALS